MAAFIVSAQGGVVGLTTPSIIIFDNIVGLTTPSIIIFDLKQKYCLI